MKKYEFNLDPKAARRVGSAPRITKTGAYKGILKDVFVYETKRGAAMLRIEFLDDEDRRASLDLCIKKADGTDAFGMGIFHALMTVCKMRYAITQICPNVPVFGDNHKQEVGRFMEMLNKRVGLFIRAVHDENQARYPDSIELMTPFDYTTGQTAAEILDKTDAKRLDLLIAGTTDRIIRKRAEDSFESPAPASEPDQSDFPDDVPF